MTSGIGTGDDNNLVTAAAIFVLVVVTIVPGGWSSLDLFVTERAVCFCTCGTHSDHLLLVGGGVGGRGENLVLDGV